MPRFTPNPKLSAQEEEALLKTLRLQREQKARVLLQVEAQNVARLKMADVAIEKVPEEATPLVAKDKKNFGNGNESMAVIAITLNAVLLSACKALDDTGKGKGKKEPKKAKAKAKPKIGAVVERLPPPTGDDAAEAIVKNAPTLDKLCKIKDKKSGEVKEKESLGARQALLTAFEAWLCNGFNDPLLPETPKLLQALCNEGLLDRAMLSEYWTNVVSTRVSDAEELLAGEALIKVSEAAVEAATKQLKEGQKVDADAAQEAKWSKDEVQNARTGNQPSPEEVAREKAAYTADTKCRDHKVLTQKKVELFQKEHVSALNAFEAAKQDLADKSIAMRTCAMMHKYGQPFFAMIGADSKAAAADGAAGGSSGAAADGAAAAESDGSS